MTHQEQVARAEKFHTAVGLLSASAGGVKEAGREEQAAGAE